MQARWGQARPSAKAASSSSEPRAWLWEERQLVSVANLTRADATAFLAFAATSPLQVETTAYGLAQANEALDDLRAGRLQGAAALVM